jgi:predicted nucleotidyltransferase
MQDAILQQVKATVRQIDPQAEVILFGSRARGDAREDSDWDFLVLTTLRESADTERLFWNALLEVELKEQVVITALIHAQHLRSNRKFSPLYKNIEEEGVAL